MSSRKNPSPFIFKDLRSGEFGWSALVSYGMKTFQNLSRQLLECLRFGRQFIRYVLIFASAFFRSRALLGCERVALRSQLAFYQESIQQKNQRVDLVSRQLSAPCGSGCRQSGMDGNLRSSFRRGVLPRCSAPSGTEGQHAICNESARGNERTRPLDFHSRCGWSASPLCSRGSLTPTLVFVCLPRTEVDYPSLW